MNWNMRLGANLQANGSCSFLVWAPAVASVELNLLEPHAQVMPMQPAPNGYFTATVDQVEPGWRYYYRLGTVDRPDPASRYQPKGVHGPSEVVKPNFDWQDSGWAGLPLRDYIIYELHVGTFTPEGTFDAILEQLPSLQELGITAIELMPVAQFPGGRNWGYDGVLPFAVQNSYGGPAGLKRLINACHQVGLAVILDVVYNHLGPEGNYLPEFGPYFSDRYRTPWGQAFNFDGEFSDEVRRFFLENALFWQMEFHIDALRLDAVHAIYDFAATPFLQELTRAVHSQAQATGRPCHLIAESDLNDARYITAEHWGGYGLDAQWSDDFHHCLHVLLTGEQTGYYSDFGGVTQFAKVFRHGYAYTGEYSAYRKRRHGNLPQHNATRQFVVCAQNHDQIGNRMRGDRLSRLTDFEKLKLAAASVLLSPFVPLLFMGEEYGEVAPFPYVISHTDSQLVEAVRHGRREEFSGFQWQGEVPDPFAETTFRSSVLDRNLRQKADPHRTLHRFYQALIGIRKATPAIARADHNSLEVQSSEL
ncbi:MAG TPA: malto-oligosyltrehalose trehalohydrolase, partial [Clostridia bacterium]|nr:malto-oligosyltrehalose trehalohydrolase [Clostridia bacterium]